MYTTFNIITFLVVLFCILFGYEELMKVIAYCDLRVRLAWVEWKTLMLRRRLKKEFKEFEEFTRQNKR